ncbi:hypothetical protein MRX96_035167 [Rhipicephalus microplus]
MTLPGGWHNGRATFVCVCTYVRWLRPPPRSRPVGPLAGTTAPRGKSSLTHPDVTYTRARRYDITARFWKASWECPSVVVAQLAAAAVAQLTKESVERTLVCLCVGPQLASGRSYGSALVQRRRMCAIFRTGLCSFTYRLSVVRCATNRLRLSTGSVRAWISFCVQPLRVR